MIGRKKCQKESSHLEILTVVIMKVAIMLKMTMAMTMVMVMIGNKGHYQ